MKIGRGKLAAAVIVFTGLFLISNYQAWAQTKEKPIELSFSNQWASTFGMSLESIKWADEVAKRTNGRVKITIHHGGTLTSSLQCYEGVVNDVSDIGQSVLQYSRGRFPVMEVVDLPGYPLNAIVSTQVANAVYNKFKPKELSDVHVLYLFAHMPGVFFSAKKPIKSLEDFRGMRIRAEGMATEIIKHLGATPVAMPKADEYESLQRGVIDGSIGTPSSFVAWKIGDVARFSTISPRAGYVSVFFVVMNMGKWNSLPADIQKVFNDVSNEWIERSGKAFNEIDVSAAANAKKAGHTFVALDQAEAARWEQAVKPMHEKWVKDATAKGLPGRDIFDYRQQMIEQFSKTYQPVKWW